MKKVFNVNKKSVSARSAKAGPEQIIRNFARKRKLTKATISTGNWSGYERIAQPGTITEVAALWHVPSIPYNPTDSTADVLIWIGIDVGNPQLIQIGTGADYLTSDGSPRYYAWYEILPTIPTVRILPTDQYPVRPDDEITGEIIQLTSTSMYMALNNYTQNWRFSLPAVDYTGPRQTADFIVERGLNSVTKQLYPLADYGQVTIRNCKINRRPARFNISEQVIMEQPAGHVISSPSAPMPPSASTFKVSQPSGSRSHRTRAVKMISTRIGNSTLSVPSFITKKKGSRKKPI